MKALACISFGQFGALLDPAGGEAQLVQRVKALDVDAADSPYQWSDVQKIVEIVLSAPNGAKIIVGGDSLGANEAPAIAQALLGKRRIDFLFGFQRSAYGEQVAVPANVVQAVSIYDPIWIDTFGLGDDPWAKAAGNTVTKLRNIALRAAHPDDYGEAQDIVFDAIKQIAGAE